MKKYFAICVCLVVIANLLGQSRSKSVKRPRPVKQPPAVLEAYRVCTDFRRMLAEDLNFDRAFEATFVKDPARRRAIASAETEFTDEDLKQIDDATAIGMYKDATQLFILIIPVVFAVDDDQRPKVFPPPIEAILERKPPNDPQKIPEFAAQLKRDIAEVRTHIDKVVAQNPAVTKGIQEYKASLLKPLEPPNRVVKPLTAYSRGHVLRLDEQYYQIDDCALIRENGKMRMIGYTFLRLRW
jgi:hypothetical protein